MPLIGLDYAHQVMELIEDGRLRFAFDIRRSGSNRREIRVWSQCVNEALSGMKFEDDTWQRDFKNVLDGIVPPHLPVSVFDLAQALNSGSEHLYNLIADGSLSLVAGAKARRGPIGSPNLDRESVVRFLTERRLP